MNSDAVSLDDRRFGAQVRPSGGVDFRLWAPAATTVELLLKVRGGVHEAAQILRTTQAFAAPGWHSVHVPEAGHGSRYRWRIDGELDVPDPASRSNPDGPHGWSEVIDPDSFQWAHPHWTGRPWHEAVIYELHIGAFTPQGSFAAAEARLAALADLGITAIELMPLASYPGRFGWGYDGVLPFAPQASHGSPADLKHLIDTAHGLGLMVLLDVVYNHFGPEGNQLPHYAPPFFSTTHQTAWGEAINFDGPRSETVRDFFMQNALHWLGEYRFDGLRLDAVHTIMDDARPDFLQTLSALVRTTFPERHIHLVVENERNDPNRLGPPGTIGRFEAQWNDDFHHPMHVMLTNEQDGYYAPFGQDTLGQLGAALANGLVWQDHHGSGRQRTLEPQPLNTLVNFLQNHDQVGNRAMGERLTQLVSEPALRLASAIQLLSPALPLLFMGEEFGATTPFFYFSDWQGELRRAVTEGRRREFAHFPAFSDPAMRELIPDPCESSTFLQSKLDWAAAQSLEGQRWLRHYRELLSLRKEWIVPRLPGLRTGHHLAERLSPKGLHLRWSFAEGAMLHMVANLSDHPLRLPPSRQALPIDEAFFTLGTLTPDHLGPWAGCWWIDHAID